MVTTNSTKSEFISSDKVEGTSVYNTADQKLGSIDDLMIDKIFGQVRYSVCSLADLSAWARIERPYIVTPFVARRSYTFFCAVGY